MRRFHLVVVVFALLALSACGGGGSAAPDATKASAPESAASGAGDVSGALADAVSPASLAGVGKAMTEPCTLISKEELAMLADDFRVDFQEIYPEQATCHWRRASEDTWVNTYYVPLTGAKLLDQQKLDRSRMKTLAAGDWAGTWQIDKGANEVVVYKNGIRGSITFQNGKYGNSLSASEALRYAKLIAAQL